MFKSGVIGAPVGHSLSPRLHAAAFDFLSIEGESTAVEVDGSDEAHLLSLVRSFDALSVTFPLKEIMFGLCDETDDLARQIGAVNTIRCINNRIVGRNVDGEGFCRAIVGELDVDVRDAAVTIIGAGGAARSVIASLLNHGVGNIDVLLRSNRGQLESFGGDPRVRGVFASSATADLVINATPVSLTGDASSLPTAAVNGDTAFIDLSYEPSETPWMTEQREFSPRVANGLMMLIWQAKLQLDWWLNAEIPISILREAVSQ
ncbi:unannotated protein [freshwater metagenome]|uniref:Unannotated protein n=1 Tax=freshwater metagenome TaxID=449393 RepID=A0A6J7CP78_9ZZZZ